MNDEKVVGFRVLNVFKSLTSAYGRAVVTVCGSSLSPCPASRVLDVLKQVFNRGRSGDAIALSIGRSEKLNAFINCVTATTGYMLRLHLY